MYDVGDKVVYPHHGAGTVVKKEKREVLGAAARVPDDQDPAQRHDGAGPVRERRQGRPAARDRREGGRRRPQGADGRLTEMPKNWNRRFKHNRDKMKTGDILELAEVVRNLALRDREKGLSTGEKQMFVKAKKILASELMYAKDMDEETCAEWLEEVLASDSPPPRRSLRRRKRPQRPRRPRPGRIPLTCPSGPSSSLRGGGSGSAWTGPRRSRSSGTSRSSPSRCAGSRRVPGWTGSSSSRRRAGRSLRSSSPRRRAAARCTPA